MRLPTASKLQLAVTCSASVVLPQDGFAHPAADEGTAFHALLDAALGERKRTGLSGSLAPATNDAQRAWLDGVLECVGSMLDEAASEVAYGYDAATGVAYLYGSHLGRNYPARPTPTTISGAVDYVAQTGVGSWLAVDLKTGLADEVPVERNWQLRFAALAVAAWHGAEVVQTAILHAPRDGSRPWWERGPLLEPLDLLPLRDDLAAAVGHMYKAERDVAEGRTPRLTQGPHCARCPAQRSCPAQTHLVRAWAGRPEEAKRDLHALLDVETAGLAWARIQAAKAVIAEAERQVYAFASTQPVPLPGGLVMGRHRKRGRDVADAEKAWPLLVERWGVETAREAMRLSTSRTALRKAAETQARRGAKREAGDAFVRELEALGVLTEKWTEDVGVYDPTDKQTQSVQPALADAAEAPPPSAAPVLSPGVPDPDPNNGAETDGLEDVNP